MLTFTDKLKEEFRQPSGESTVIEKEMLYSRFLLLLRSINNKKARLNWKALCIIIYYFSYVLLFDSKYMIIKIMKLVKYELSNKLLL